MFVWALSYISQAGQEDLVTLKGYGAYQSEKKHCLSKVDRNRMGKKQKNVFEDKREDEIKRLWSDEEIKKLWSDEEILKKWSEKDIIKEWN